MFLSSESYRTMSPIKVPMKWNFSPLFYSRKLRSTLHWFIIFEFKLWSDAQNNFSIPPKLANSSQNVRHSARGQNMQISTVDVIRIASEGNKRRSGKFFVTRGPVLASCKTPLTLKALCYLYFRKTKSEEQSLLAICLDTPTQLQMMNATLLSLHFEQSFYRWLLNSGDPLQCH